MATAASIAILVILYILEYSLPRYGPSYLGVIVSLLFLVVVALLMVKTECLSFVTYYFRVLASLPSFLCREGQLKLRSVKLRKGLR